MLPRPHLITGIWWQQQDPALEGGGIFFLLQTPEMEQSCTKWGLCAPSCAWREGLGRELKCEYFVSINTGDLLVVWKQPCSYKQPLPSWSRVCVLGNHCWEAARGSGGAGGDRRMCRSGSCQDWAPQSPGREGGEQRDPEDTRAAFVDTSCGKSCLTDGAGGGGALQRVRSERQLRVRGWCME